MLAFFMRATEVSRCDGEGGDCDEDEGNDGGGVEDLVVGGVAGAVEEEVVLDSVEGDDGHRDLDVAALVGGGEDVEGGYAQAQGSSGDCVED